MYTLKRLIADCARKTWRTRRAQGHPRARADAHLRGNLDGAQPVDPRGAGAGARRACAAVRLFCVGVGRVPGTKSKPRPIFILDSVMTREFGREALAQASQARQRQQGPRDEFHRACDPVVDHPHEGSRLHWLARPAATAELVIKAGNKCKVRFGCGKLLVKEGKVAFAFDPNLHIRRNSEMTVDDEQTLPVGLTVAADSEIGALLNESSEAGSSFPTGRSQGTNAARPGSLSARLVPSSSAPALGTARRMERQQFRRNAAAKAGVTTLNLAAAGITTPRTSRGDEEKQLEQETQQKEEDDGVPLSVPPSSRNSEDERNEDSRKKFNADRSCVFAVSEKYRGGGAPDRLDRKAMRAALDLAYERHMIDIEGQIAGEEAQADHWRMQLWERELGYRAEVEKRRNDLEALDEFLRGQIVEQKKRLKEEDLDVRGVHRKGKAYPDFRRMKRLAKRYGVRRGSDGEIIVNSARSTFSAATDRTDTPLDADGVGAETARRRREEAVELGAALRQQIQRRMKQAENDRRHELEEGRRFIDQITEDSRRMLLMREQERATVAADLKGCMGPRHARAKHTEAEAEGAQAWWFRVQVKATDSNSWGRNRQTTEEKEQERGPIIFSSRARQGCSTREGEPHRDYDDDASRREPRITAWGMT